VEDYDATGLDEWFDGEEVACGAGDRVATVNESKVEFFCESLEGFGSRGTDDRGVGEAVQWFAELFVRVDANHLEWHGARREEIVDCPEGSAVGYSDFKVGERWARESEGKDALEELLLYAVCADA